MAMNTAHKTSLIEPDPHSAFYETPELAQRIKLIHHLIAHSEQLLLVLAEEGRGKTTLLRQIAAAADEHWKVFVLASTPALGGDALLGKLLSDFNVRPEGKPTPALRDALRTHIAATRYNGQLPVLIVDDAHMLPLETLTLLVQLAMTDEPQTRMRVLLFCEPQITSVFAAPEFGILRNTLIHTLDIPPFSEKQVRGYLKLYQQQINFRGENPFTDLMAHSLYLDTEGVPGAVNKRARQLLGNQAGHLSDLNGSPGARTRRYGRIVGLGLLLSGVLAAGWWLKARMEFAPDRMPEILPLEVPEPALLDTSPLLSPALNPQLLPDALRPETPPPQPVGESDLASPLAEAAAPATLDAEELTLLPGVHDESWLRAQGQEQFTLQLLGAYVPQAIEKFIITHGVQGELAMFKSIYRDKDWYVLVYGLYPDRSQATAAISSLPATLRRATQPWVRSLGSIHAELERVR